MTHEEEPIQLREANSALHEHLAQRDARIEHVLTRMHTLEEPLNTHSHTSHVPPSSDRCVRQITHLRSLLTSPWHIVNPPPEQRMFGHTWPCDALNILCQATRQRLLAGCLLPCDSS